VHRQSITINAQSGRISVTLDLVAEEDYPHALLGAHDANGEQLAQVRVDAGFKLSKGSANAWSEDDFRKPG